MKKNFIIKRYEKDGYMYKIEYLDGTTATYYCSGDDHEQTIINNMLEQITLKQTKDSAKDYYIKKNVATACLLESAVTCVAATAMNKEQLGAFSLLGSYYSLCFLVNYKKRINEMKKIKMFLEMNHDLEMINKSTFLKCIEFDNMYQVPLNVNTVDDYSYGDVKTLYRKYKKEKNK